MPQPHPGRHPNAPPRSEPLLAGLTPEQAQAVTHGTAPLLLIAGPGAGKTRTLTYRIAHLLESGRAQPRDILALTFSVRAAGELRLRLADLLGEATARGVIAATFHSLCARLLRDNAPVFGRTEDYTIYDAGDMRRVIDDILADPNRETVKTAVATCGQPQSSELLAELSLAKNRLLDPEGYRARTRHPAGELIATLWRECDLELERSNAVSFDDLLALAVRLLREQPGRLGWIRRRWRWLVCDEYQDANCAQAELVWLLAGPDGNVAAVADDDQLIHRFRGADPEHVLRFSDRYPDHATILLGHNFRSRAEILDAAVRCVAHNERRTDKTLVAVRGPGGRVQVRAFGSEWQEAHWTAARIGEAIAAGTAGPEILLLARTGYATQPMQMALARAGIPHRVLGSLGLYERAEVKDALAYLTLLVNPVDGQAFSRAVQSPRRGVGPATIASIVTRAREKHEGDVLGACLQATTIGEIRNRAVRERLVRFGTGLARIGEEMRAGRSLGHVVLATVMVEGGLVENFELVRDTSSKASVRRDAERVLEDLRSLCRAAQSFEAQHGAPASLRDFLEHAVGLHAEELSPGEDRRVTVSTIHRAKGVEAEFVILLGCEEQLLPSWQSLASPDAEALAEERRLFYVAATRAKDRLLITHAAERGQRPTGGPSRFLAEAGLTGVAGALAA